MPTSKQRRDAERRRLERQQRRRVDQETRRRRRLALLTVVNVVVVVGAVVGLIIATTADHGRSKAGGPATSPSPGVSAPTEAPPTPGATSGTSSAASGSASDAASGAAASGVCSWHKSGTAARAVALPPTRPPRKGKVDVAVQTAQGPMVFALDRSRAPCAVANFLSLARQGYFDRTACHRLTTAQTLSVLQCGDPSGTGGGGPGYTFADELTSKEKYERGVLAMANAGPNTNGSQFFIVYRNSQLNPNYPIFGRVTQGLGVVDGVAAKGSTPAQDGAPNQPLVLTKVTAPK